MLKLDVTTPSPHFSLFFSIFFVEQGKSALFSLGFLPVSYPKLSNANWKAVLYRFSVSSFYKAVSWRRPSTNPPKVFQPFGWRSKSLPARPAYKGFTQVPFLYPKPLQSSSIYKHFPIFREMEPDNVLVLSAAHLHKQSLLNWTSRASPG